MRWPQVLLTVGIVVVALAVYHVLADGGDLKEPYAAGESARSAAGDAEDARLGPDALEARLSDIERRLTALERDAGEGARTSPSGTLNLGRFRELLGEARRQEDAEQKRRQIEAAVRGLAGDARERDVEAAVNLLARYYADMAAAYEEVKDLDVEARKAVQRRVDSMQQKLVEELTLFLPADAVERLTRGLPGGSRDMPASDPPRGERADGGR